MTALNCSNASSNFTRSGKAFSFSTGFRAGQKNYADLKFDFTPSWAYAKARPQFNFTPAWAVKGSKPNFNFTPSWAANGAKPGVFNLNYALASPSAPKQVPTEIFNRPALLESSDPSLKGRRVSPLILSSVDVITDVSGNMRQFFATTGQLGVMDNPAVIAGLGVTSGFSILSGAVNISKGLKDVDTAKKIEDGAGRVLGYTDVVRGSAQIGGGASLVPARVSTVASVLSTSKVLGTLGSVLGGIGMGLTAFAGVLKGIPIAVNIHELRLFRKGYKEAISGGNLSEEELIVKGWEYIRSAVQVSPEEKAAISNELMKDPAFAAISFAQQREAMACREKLLLDKKEAVFKRTFNADLWELVTKGEPANAKEIVAAVNKCWTRKTVISSVAIGVISVVAIAVVVCMVMSAPIFATIGAFIMMGISLALLIPDGIALVEEFKRCHPGRFDKLIILLSTVLALAVVTVICVLSAGIVPMIAAGVVGAIWLAINIACYYRIHQFEKRKK